MKRTSLIVGFLGLSLLWASSSPLLTGCGKVCVGGIGDCSELKKFNNPNNGGGGDLSLTVTPTEINVNGKANAKATGGKPRYAFKIVNSSACQLQNYSATAGTAVIQGVSAGACMIRVTDADGLFRNASITVNGPVN
jgi:hypothetical protein